MSTADRSGLCIMARKWSNVTTCRSGSGGRLAVVLALLHCDGECCPRVRGEREVACARVLAVSYADARCEVGDLDTLAAVVAPTALAPHSVGQVSVCNVRVPRPVHCPAS